MAGGPEPRPEDVCRWLGTEESEVLGCAGVAPERRAGSGNELPGCVAWPLGLFAAVIGPLIELLSRLGDTPDDKPRQNTLGFLILIGFLVTAGQFQDLPRFGRPGELAWLPFLIFVSLILAGSLGLFWGRRRRAWLERTRVTRIEAGGHGLTLRVGEHWHELPWSALRNVRRAGRLWRLDVGRYAAFVNQVGTAARVVEAAQRVLDERLPVLLRRLPEEQFDVPETALSLAEEDGPDQDRGLSRVDA